MNEQVIPWEDVVATLFRRRQLIIRVAVAGIATVAIWCWLQPPVYRAAAKLMVRAQRARMTVSPDANARPVLSRRADQEINSEVAFLTSPSLIQEVLEQHRERLEPGDAGEHGPIRRLASMLTYPLELPAIAYRRVHGMPPADPFDRWVAAAAKNLEVNPISKSDLIEVSYQSRDPKWAAQFVNELLSRHIDHYTRLHQQSGAQRFFERQRELLGNRLQQAKAALKAFREGRGAHLPMEDEATLRNNLAQLESARASAQTELAETRARIAFLTSEIKKHPTSIAAESRVMENQAVQFLKPRILELEMQRNEVLTRYASGSTKVQDIDRQIAEARNLLAKEEKTVAETMTAVNPAHQALQLDLVQTRAQTASVKARLQALSSQIDDYQQKLDRVEEIASEQERLQQEVTSAKETYLTYLKKEEEARFSKALDDSRIVNVSVAEGAQAPNHPAPSKKMLAMLLGAIMSLVAGTALAFVSDRVDPAVKSTTQARRATGLPILAEIPL